MNKRKTIGLALSGGGIRGFAHLGAIKALEEANIPIDYIAGTSAGALIGACVATGMKVDDIYDFLKVKDVFSLTEFSLPSKGILNFKRLAKEMRKELPYHRFEDLPIPLTVVATNLQLGKPEYINSGNFIEAAMASASIPAIFSPVRIGEYDYCDGGVFDNMPIKTVRKHADIVVGINISTVNEIKDIGSISDIAARTFQLSVNSNSMPDLSTCDIYITPDGIRDFGLLDTEHIDAIYQAGYQAAKEKLSDEIPEALRIPTFWERTNETIKDLLGQ